MTSPDKPSPSLSGALCALAASYRCRVCGASVPEPLARWKLPDWSCLCPKCDEEVNSLLDNMGIDEGPKS